MLCIFQYWMYKINFFFCKISRCLENKLIWIERKNKWRIFHWKIIIFLFHIFHFKWLELNAILLFFYDTKSMTLTHIWLSSICSHSLSRFWVFFAWRLPCVIYFLINSKHLYYTFFYGEIFNCHVIVITQLSIFYKITFVNMKILPIDCVSKQKWVDSIGWKTQEMEEFCVWKKKKKIKCVN